MLTVEAQQEADMYWASHNLAREDAGEDEQGGSAPVYESSERFH